MFWHAEGMKTAYSGEVIWNGEKCTVAPDTYYGYVDKTGVKILHLRGCGFSPTTLQAS